jgi:hypothetical protein
MGRNRAMAFTLLTFAAGCAGPPQDPGPPRPAPAWTAELDTSAGELLAHLREQSPAGVGGLVIRLAFNTEADLDLYVSDPLQETIYYANTPARSGGRLRADRHCKEAPMPGPRVEEVVFDAPPPGAYRIGVDYPHRCDSKAGITAYAITVDLNGTRRELRGLAEPVVFDSIVTEYEIAVAHQSASRKAVNR